VRRAGRRAGTTRPFQLFELTAEVEQLLSRAYMPLMMQVFRSITERLTTREINALMHRAGKSLAGDLRPSRGPSGSLRSRVFIASRLLNKELGAVTHVKENGTFVIQGAICPLAALTGKHPAVCLAMESFVKAIVAAKVHECCDRTARPRCCFEIAK
jgi:predicted ArsR family transcriptional regulator